MPLAHYSSVRIYLEKAVLANMCSVLHDSGRAVVRTSAAGPANPSPSARLSLQPRPPSLGPPSRVCRAPKLEKARRGTIFVVCAAQGEPTPGTPDSGAPDAAPCSSHDPGHGGRARPGKATAMGSLVAIGAFLVFSFPIAAQARLPPLSAGTGSPSGPGGPPGSGSGGRGGGGGGDGGAQQGAALAGDADERRRAGGEGRDSSEVLVDVKGMHCGGCVDRIKQALLKVPGVASADISLSDESASVRIDPSHAREGDIEVRGARVACQALWLDACRNDRTRLLEEISIDLICCIPRLHWGCP